MSISIARVGEILQNSENVYILTHKNPDGDCLGTGAALCRYLISIGKRAIVVNSDPIPPKYDYLFEGLPQESFEPETVIAVDVADPKLLGSYEPLADRTVLCIDHHVSNKLYAKETYLCPEDGAAALSLYRIFRELDIPIDRVMADCLYTGLSTDTGCFRYSNANAECYRAAADLIELGADNARINVVMFETKPYADFMILSDAFAGLRLFYGGKVSVLKVSQEMLKARGATEDSFEFVTAMSRQIEGVLCGITMKQIPSGEYKISLRTREPLDASDICAQLGGGGHMRAAGCTAGDDEEASLHVLLDYLAKLLGEEPERGTV